MDESALQENNNPIVLQSTGERLLPGRLDHDSLEHLHRYALALEFCRSKDVADIASGEGYGSNLLAQVSQSVIGIDISPEAVRHAQALYQKPNLKYKQGSVTNIPMDSNAVDVVVSFETIEHHDQHEEMLTEIKRILRRDGILIISSPDKLNYSELSGYVNPHHVKELYLDEFRSLVRKKFRNVEILFQRLVYGSIIVPEDETGSFLEFEGNFEHLKANQSLSKPLYNLCIASDSTLPMLGASLFESLEVLDNLMTERQKVILDSASFRLGRLLTWPIRKLTKPLS